MRFPNGVQILTYKLCKKKMFFKNSLRTTTLQFVILQCNHSQLMEILYHYHFNHENYTVKMFITRGKLVLTVTRVAGDTQTC